jgi:hypothetical protein
VGYGACEQNVRNTQETVAWLLNVRNDSPNETVGKPPVVVCTSVGQQIFQGWCNKGYSQVRASIDEKDRTDDAMRIREVMVDVPNFIFLTLVYELKKKSKQRGDNALVAVLGAELRMAVSRFRFVMNLLPSLMPRNDTDSRPHTCITYNVRKIKTTCIHRQCAYNSMVRVVYAIHSSNTPKRSKSGLNQSRVTRNYCTLPCTGKVYPYANVALSDHIHEK